MNENTHRLTDLPGEKHPHKCQSCGQQGFLSGAGGIQLLTRWQECDDRDKKELKVVVLCYVCARDSIQQHPRLYHQLDKNTPFPGAMSICIPCRHRSGVTCRHPKAKINGGFGVALTIGAPISGFIDGPKYRGPMQIWTAAATDCEGLHDTENS